MSRPVSLDDARSGQPRDAVRTPIRILVSSPWPPMRAWRRGRGPQRTWAGLQRLRRGGRRAGCVACSIWHQPLAQPASFLQRCLWPGWFIYGSLGRSRVRRLARTAAGCAILGSHGRSYFCCPTASNCWTSWPGRKVLEGSQSVLFYRQPFEAQKPLSLSSTVSRVNELQPGWVKMDCSTLGVCPAQLDGCAALMSTHVRECTLRRWFDHLLTRSCEGDCSTALLISWMHAYHHVCPVQTHVSSSASLLFIQPLYASRYMCKSRLQHRAARNNLF